MPGAPTTTADFKMNPERYRTSGVQMGTIGLLRLAWQPPATHGSSDLNYNELHRKPQFSEGAALATFPVVTSVPSLEHHLLQGASLG